MAADTQLGLQPIEDVKPDEDDLRLWSVTTIIGVLESKGLQYWAAEMSAVAAVGQQNTWRGMLADCPEGCLHTSARDCAAVKWLRDAMNRRPKTLLSSSDLGTVAHTLFEEYGLTGVRPDRDRIGTEVRAHGDANTLVDLEVTTLDQMLDQFDGWLQRFTPSFQATEVVVYSPTYGYAGTADAFLTLDGTRFIADYKTSREPRDGKGRPKTPFPEVALQLAAYRGAEAAAVWRPRRTKIQFRRYYLLSPAERQLAVPVPEVDAGICVHVTTEACEAFPVDCGPEVHTNFLYVQEAARWHLQEARKAIGDPLVPADAEAVAS